MTRSRPYPAPRTGRPIKSKPTLEQLINARRPLLFSRMPRMLRDDGEMVAGALRESSDSENDHASKAVPMSEHRWRVALQMSRILRAQRRRGSRVH